MAFTLVRGPASRGDTIGSLVFGRAVTFDGTITADHSDEVDLTTHPVEDDVDVTDHVQKKQPTLTLTGMVTNTPINATAATEADRAILAYEALLGLLGEEVTVTTAIRVYPNVVLTSVGVPRQQGGRQLNALQFAVAFRQVVKASPVFVKFDPAILEDDEDDERAPAASGASEAERGAQESEPTAEEVERGSTTGIDLLTTIGGEDVLGGAAPIGG